MKYAYEDLSEDQFEKLIVILCQRLLGVSVQGFSKGPDGGRDAKFVGTAELYPSKTAPWAGITIIQAKHTNGYNTSFSESDFFSRSSSNTVIGKEIPRIKKLRDSKRLDHYILFANRRLAANTETDIVEHISKECHIPIESIALCGLETLEIWMKTYPDIPRIADLDPLDSPLLISPDDLSDIVQAFVRQRDRLINVLDTPPTTRISYEDKNRINNMSPEYAKEQRKRYLKETAQISTFLASPENIELLRMYESVIEEFQLKIIAHRKDYQSFDKVMNHLADLLFERDAVLKQHKHKRLTRAMLFYMYWNCDIGEVEDATAN